MSYRFTTELSPHQWRDCCLLLWEKEGDPWLVAVVYGCTSLVQMHYKNNWRAGCSGDRGGVADIVRHRLSARLRLFLLLLLTGSLKKKACIPQEWVGLECWRRQRTHLSVWWRAVTTSAGGMGRDECNGQCTNVIWGHFNLRSDGLQSRRIVGANRWTTRLEIERTYAGHMARWTILK